MPVRQHLSRGADFLLPYMLQGGTWAAGRPVVRRFGSRRS
jgi:hypothetical protein